MSTKIGRFMEKKAKDLLVERMEKDLNLKVTEKAGAQHIDLPVYCRFCDCSMPAGTIFCPGCKRSQE